MPTVLKDEGARVKAAVLKQWGSLVDCAKAMGESRYKIYDTVAGRPQDAQFLTKLARFCQQPEDAFYGLRRPDLTPEAARRQEKLNANLALARAAGLPTAEARQLQEARLREFAVVVSDRAAELGLSHAEVARAVGVHPSQAMHWMRGSARPKTGRLPALAQVLQLDPHRLADQLGIPRAKRPFKTPPPRITREAPLSTIGLPAGLLTLLRRAGLHSVGELIDRTPSAVEAIPHVGPGGLRRVEEALAACGLQLAPEPRGGAERPPAPEEVRDAPREPEEETPPPPLAERPAPVREAAPESAAAGPADYTASPLWQQAHQLTQLVLVGLDRMQEEGPLRHALWHAVVDLSRYLALASRARRTTEMARSLHRAAECALSAEYYLRLAADMRLLPQGVGELALGQLAALAGAIEELAPEATP